MLASHTMVSAGDLAALLHAPRVDAAPKPPAILSGGTIAAGNANSAVMIHPSYRLYHPADNATPFNGPSPYGLSPIQIRHAYGLDQVTLPGTSTLADGSGQTIAIVDAFNSPNIRSDLQAFDQQFGLADPIGDAFKIVSQTGSTTNLPGVDPSGPGSAGSWDLEVSLDVEVVHALAPGANILLVEANSNGAGDLQNAINFARQQTGVVVVSMSFGYGEASNQTMTDGIFTTPSGRGGVTFVAATGDSGLPAFYPAFSPNVLAAGGTTLTVDTSGNILNEAGWSGSGGGVSTVESQPAYQNGVVTQFSSTKRTVPDVAFDGDPNTGASVYDSYDYGTVNPWVKVGGTSLSAPGWAALIAIADQARSSIGLGPLDGPTQTLPMLYSFAASDFNDITSGNNGSPAGPGYDLVTGLGTPKAVVLINDLVGAFHVATSNPASGSAVATPPTDFAITFSSPYANAGIVAGDLSVNGIAADSFTSTDSTTITFHFNASPVTTQGLQTMSMPPGVLTRQADGAPLSAFNGSFRYDVLPIAIDGTTPADHSIAPAPLSTLSVHFNEAFDSATIGVSDLTVSQGSVSGFSIVDSQTVQYALSGVNAPGTLSIAMAAGAVTDTFGNPGPAYSGTIFLDGPTTAFPTPLTQVKPAGSLVYQGSASGSILFAGNTVSYTLALAAGQTLSLAVTPSAALQALVSIVGSGLNTSATSSAAGAPATLQLIPIATDATYTITVSGLNGTTGNYSIAADLNAAISTSASGAGNHTLASAQNIDGSFLTLAGTSKRAAVVAPSTALAGPNAFGYAAIAIPSQFDDITTTGMQIAFLSPTANLPTQLGPTSPSGISFPFYGTTYNAVYVNPHGVITISRAIVNGTNTDLSSIPITATIAALWDNLTISGSPQSAGYYKLEPTANGNRLVIEWTHLSFVGGPQTGQVTFEAILGSNGTIIFNYRDVDGSLMRSGDLGPTVGIKNANAAGADPLVVSKPSATSSIVASGGSLEIAPNILPAVNDYYAFTLGAGQTTTLAVAAQNSAAVHISLVDSQGNPLAAGSSPGGGSPLSEAINDFAAPAGTYYALVTGAPGAAYSLTVTRNAAFAAGNNVSFATAQDVAGARGALGAISTAASENWYSITLPANSELSLQTYTPGSSASQFVNNLAPAIELYDSSDVLIASGQGARNQTLVQTIATAGAYRIRVHAADSSTGEYFVSIAVNATPPQVAGVYASGTDWSTAFYAYLANNGLGDAQLGYRLAGGANQLAPLPWTNVTTISVVFSEDVAINTAASGLGLVGSPDLAPPAALGSATFNYSSATHTAQWAFAAPLGEDKYLLNIPSSAVANIFGMSLDGDWTTGASGFPSGDGTAGGDFSFRFNVLPGDVDQNGVVTGPDGIAVRNHLLQDTTMAGYSPLFDVNADGAITSQDGAIVRMQLLHALPDAEPTPPGSGFARLGPAAGGQGPASASLASPAGAVASGNDQSATVAKPLRRPSATTNLVRPIPVPRMIRTAELAVVNDLVLEEFGMVTVSARRLH